MSEKRWFEQLPPDPQPGDRKREESPARDLWVRCPGCEDMLYRPDLAVQHQVCQHCAHHFRLGVEERIDLLADPDSWERHDADLAPVDVLEFVDSKPYADRIVASQAKVGENDAFRSGSCTLDGISVELGMFDFRFMGGSMGSVVGECIARLYERALERKHACIVISASGGARMQEGALSLMQMAKTCAALARFQESSGKPYISLLTDPTTGGVAASFAMLGDLILAEPHALIGFAGPRVIEQTIGESLPDDFQTSEYLLEHGLVDQIVHRWDLRDTLARHLRWLGAA